MFGQESCTLVKLPLYMSMEKIMCVCVCAAAAALGVVWSLCVHNYKPIN